MEYRHDVPEWFMPSRRDLGPSERPRAMTVMMTELSDTSGGRVVVETRRLLRREWETAIYPADAVDGPDEPDAAVFAVCVIQREALAAHEQAVEFATNALNSTLRRATP